VRACVRACACAAAAACAVPPAIARAHHVGVRAGLCLCAARGAGLCAPLTMPAAVAMLSAMHVLRAPASRCADGPAGAQDYPSRPPSRGISLRPVGTPPCEELAGLDARPHSRRAAQLQAQTLPQPQRTSSPGPGSPHYRSRTPAARGKPGSPGDGARSLGGKTLSALSLSLAGAQTGLAPDAKTGPPALIGRRSSAASRWANTKEPNGGGRPGSSSAKLPADAGLGVEAGSPAAAAAGALGSWGRLVPPAGAPSGGGGAGSEGQSGSQGLGPWGVQ
jgi:hypothetical protein